MLTMSDKELVKLGEEVIGPLSYGEIHLMKLVQDKLVELNTVEKKLTTQPLSDDVIKKMWTMSAIFGTNLEKAVALTRAIEKAHGITDER